MKNAKRAQLERFKIETATKIYCLNATCVNLVPEDYCCNLKRLVINAEGKCAGFVKMEPEKPETEKKEEADKK